MSDSMDPGIIWKFLKMYCVSLNKIAFNAVSDGTFRFRNPKPSKTENEYLTGLKQIFASLDHALLHWATEIDKNIEFVNYRNLEAFMQQFLETAMNKSLFDFRKRKFLSAAFSQSILEAVNGIYDSLKISHHPDTLHLCARFCLAKAVFSMEDSSFVTAINFFTEALKLLSHELEIRFRKSRISKRKQWPPKLRYKLRRCVLPSFFSRKKTL